MLDPALVNQIEDLLAEGTPQREIAEQFDVSRSTVGAIARGEWCVKAPPPAQPVSRPNPIDKCPTCGRTIRLPCLACRTERLRAAGKLPAPPPDLAQDAPLAIDVGDGEDRATYHAMRCKHLRADSVHNGRTAPVPRAPRRCKRCRPLKPSQIPAHDPADDLAGEAEDVESLNRLTEG